MKLGAITREQVSRSRRAGSNVDTNRDIKLGGHLPKNVKAIVAGRNANILVGYL